MPLAVDPDVAPEFFCDAPGVLLPEFAEPEFGELDFVEPEFAVAGSDPGFGVAGLELGFDVAGFVEPAVPAALPGRVVHADPLGIVPGVLVEFGFGWSRRAEIHVCEIQVAKSRLRKIKSETP